jgi:MSHA pilin protein MshC
MNRAMRIRGFSLVELIAVIGIAAALAAVAIPRFANQQTFQERGFYDEALSAARYAQKFAVASGCEVQLSVAGGVYSLTQRATTCTTGAFTRNVVHPGSGAVSFTGTAPAGLTFTLSASPVVFDALGRTTDGATRTVTVGSKTFQIIGATGYVQAP